MFVEIPRLEISITYCTLSFNALAAERHLQISWTPATGSSLKEIVFIAMMNIFINVTADNALFYASQYYEEYEGNYTQYEAQSYFEILR